MFILAIPFIKFGLSQKKYIELSRNIAYKIPKWYPLRGFAIDNANGKNKVTLFDKTMSIIEGIFIIGWLTILFITWFTGK